VTAVIVVRWKPSARSRSLSGIFSLEQPHRSALARIVARSSDFGRFAPRDPASPFQSARGSVRGGGYRPFHVETACATYFFLVD